MGAGDMNIDATLLNTVGDIARLLNRVPDGAGYALTVVMPVLTVLLCFADLRAGC